MGHRELARFARMLERRREGILNHCAYPVHTSKLEGVNNPVLSSAEGNIKVIKRRAYGYHDPRYFALKVMQTFDPANRQLFGR